MKKILFLIMFVVGVLSFGMLTSCTNELPYPIESVKLVKAPEVLAYSNGHSLGVVTRSAQPNTNEWGTDANGGKYKDYPKPADITKEELAKVLEVFNQKGLEHYEPLVDWQNFFVQQVYCGPEGGKMTELAAIVDYKVEINVKNWWPYEADTTYVKVEPFYDIVNNFNNGAYSGDTEQGCMLMFDSSTLDWSWKSTQGGGERFTNWRMEVIDGCVYVGFDFQSNKQGSDSNDNEYFERDYIYNDWIIKLVPAVGIETPSKPDVTPEIPDTVIGDMDEVEINLSIQDTHENWKDLVSHLSIHVRAATDVEVFIPVPVSYYCEADDMAIVEKHIDGLLIHGGPSKTVYNVGGHEVSLNIAFENGGIRIWTDGINQEVIDYCYENYGDGITFEVWNYFNETILGTELLKSYLDRSYVTFLDKEPGKYVNAFNQTDNGDKFGNDCVVSIVESQNGHYDDGNVGYHYNGSPYNEIYLKK